MLLLKLLAGVSLKSDETLVCINPIEFVFQDMFFKYTWNNFLHTQVEICIALILASPLESTENGTITDQDSTGDNLLLKHVSCVFGRSFSNLSPPMVW